MAIQIQNAAEKPAIIYDKIHLTHLEISQKVFTDDTLTPVFNLSLSYRHYGVVDGVRYYLDEEPIAIVVPDYMGRAMTAAAAGDMSLVTAMQAIEGVVASLIATQTGGVATVI